MTQRMSFMHLSFQCPLSLESQGADTHVYLKTGHTHPDISHRHPSSYTSYTLNISVHAHIRQLSVMVPSHQVSQDSATRSSKGNSTNLTSGPTAPTSNRTAMAYVFPGQRAGKPEAWVTARYSSGEFTDGNGVPERLRDGQRHTQS